MLGWQLIWLLGITLLSGSLAAQSYYKVLGRELLSFFPTRSADLGQYRRMRARQISKRRTGSVARVLNLLAALMHISGCRKSSTQI